MDYKDFYDMATYLNKERKGSFTQKEVACNAYDYTCEFRYSKRDEMPTHTIKELAKLLAEDGSEDCKDWLYQIASELGLIDMDYTNYLDTDEWLSEFIERK